MRWEELSWDKVRRAQMRWMVQCEVWGKKSEVWSVDCEVWSVDCEVWRLECEECSVKCGLWSAQCEVWSLECEECSVKCEECGAWSAKSAVWRVQCEVCSVECEDCQVWSVKWSFKCDMWNKTPVSQSACTHGLGWRTAHASSIDEKGLLYMVVDQNSFIPERPFFANKKITFANSMFIFRGAHVGQQHLLWRFVHHLPNYARESRITSW